MQLFFPISLSGASRKVYNNQQTTSRNCIGRVVKISHRMNGRYMNVLFLLCSFSNWSLWANKLTLVYIWVIFQSKDSFLWCCINSMNNCMQCKVYVSVFFIWLVRNFLYSIWPPQKVYFWRIICEQLKLINFCNFSPQESSLLENN